MAKATELLYELFRGSFDYPEGEELDELAEKMRDMIVTLRLVPADLRRSILSRLFWVINNLLYFVVLSAVEENDLPEPLRDYFRYRLTSLYSVTTKFLREYVCDPTRPTKGRISLISKPQHLAHNPTGNIFREVLKVRKNFLKGVALRRQRLAKRFVSAKPLRATEATVFVSEANPSIHVVMNRYAMGRGESIKDAVNDFLRRWRLLIQADFLSRIPYKTYIEELKLQPCGKIFVTEYEGGEVSWKFVPSGGDQNDDGRGSVLTGAKAAPSGSPRHSGSIGGQESGKES